MESIGSHSRPQQAVEKNGYTQLDVNTIQIDAEATSIGVRLTDPAIYPVARGSGCGF